MYVENADSLGHYEKDDRGGRNPGSHFSEAQSTM